MIYLQTATLRRNKLEEHNRINLTGASPDFTRDEFLAHVQARINTALNTYASSNATQKAASELKNYNSQERLAQQ